MDIYHDSSLQALGICVVIYSEFEDGTHTYRVLKTKSKLNGREVLHICRGELMGALIAVRTLNIVRADLSQFISQYKHDLSWRIIGDSQIVLNQIFKQYFLFKSWSASRIYELQSLLKTVTQPVDLCYVPSAENISDVLTREWSQEPSSIPWATDLQVPENISKFQPTQDTLNLPEIDKAKVVNN